MSLCNKNVLNTIFFECDIKSPQEINGIIPDPAKVQY